MYVFTVTSPLVRIDETSKSQLLVFWSISFLLLQISLRPYYLDKDNVLETLALGCLALATLFQTGRCEDEILPAGVAVFLGGYCASWPRQG